MKLKIKFSLWLSILKTKKSMPLVEVKKIRLIAFGRGLGVRASIQGVTYRLSMEAAICS